MAFASRATQRELAQLSRNLGVALFSGVDIIKAFQLATKKQSGRMAGVLKDVTTELKSGRDVTSALEAHDHFFPDLFIDMVQVGELTGSLPEVLKAMGTHYENNIRLRRDFISRMTFPVVQLIAAVFIIAGLITLMGWIAETTGAALDPLGWGLLGPQGAMVWLGTWAIGVVGVLVAYKTIGASLAGLKTMHKILMGVPVVGNCLQAFAIARFSWAFHLTQQAGMPIDDSIEASLRATSNGAFIAATQPMIDDVSSGETLTEAMENTTLFPEDFLQMVHVAETSGTVPEALDRLSPQFEDDARRSMVTLASVAGWTIRCAVGAVIVFFIFRIALWYIGMLNDITSSI
ncbi:MAG: type II secretion system F family protein [Planctomycetaceae bacterium]|nr:type II secretion system F family protein [Planctomycetaceae bacterium]